MSTGLIIDQTYHLDKEQITTMHPNSAYTSLFPERMSLTSRIAKRAGKVLMQAMQANKNRVGNK